MNRRHFMGLAAALTGGAALGCKSGKQFAEVRDPNKQDMVGSHTAGVETFKPLVEGATAKLLARHSSHVMPAGATELPPPAKRICFVAVENKSSEEIGDFKDQIYQIIDQRIVDSHVFQPINKRFVDAGLIQTRLRPDQLFVPQNMGAFAAAMQQQGQPFDYLLYATLTSGTTRENKDYQRDYLLTLEMIDIGSGTYDKESETLSKGYYHSRPAKWLSLTGLKH
ncbi:MAG: twin-arginine translocation signal domain-containing protein [Planctomycetes bacterium]|nr:twin-arginine translocation signal domain-containing protein [Planctomycetota bacterium]